MDAFQSAVTGARVVHFGHGHEKSMMFEDGHGARGLGPKALRNRVSACSVGTCKLVVLNSCKSEDENRAFVAARRWNTWFAVAQNQNNGRISIARA